LLWGVGGEGHFSGDCVRLKSGGRGSELLPYAGLPQVRDENLVKLVYEWALVERHAKDLGTAHLCRQETLKAHTFLLRIIALS